MLSSLLKETSFLYANAIPIGVETDLDSKDQKYLDQVVNPSLLRLPHNFIHGLGKVIHVVRIQTSHTDPSILGHVDVSNISQL